MKKVLTLLVGLIAFLNENSFIEDQDGGSERTE